MIRKYLYFLFLMPLFLFSCISNPTQSKSNSELTGVVHLLNAFHQPINNHSNVIINIEETNYYTQSDSTGRWNFYGLSLDTVTLNFHKKGYEQFKLVNILMPESGIHYTGLMDMYPTPALTIESITLYEHIWYGVSFLVHLSKNSECAGLSKIVLYYGKNQSVSCINNQHLFYDEHNIFRSTNTYQNIILTIRVNHLKDYFESGEIIFVRAYVYSNDENRKYEIENRIDAINLNPTSSNVLQFEFMRFF